MSRLLALELQELWPVFLRHDVDVISSCLVSEELCPENWVSSYKSHGLCYYVMMLTSSVVFFFQRSHVPITGIQELCPVLLRQDVDVISSCLVSEESCPDYWVWSYKSSGLRYYVMMLTSSVVVLFQRSYVPITGSRATRALACVSTSATRRRGLSWSRGIKPGKSVRPSIRFRTHAKPEC